MTPVLFDRRLLRLRRARAAVLGPSTFLLERVAQDLAERLAAVLRRFERASELGEPSDIVRNVLLESNKVSMLPPIVSDEEALPFRDGSLDLLVSALSLQFVNDLPGTLVQIRRALRPDGLFLAAMTGGDTLTELREA